MSLKLTTLVLFLSSISCKIVAVDNKNLPKLMNSLFKTPPRHKNNINSTVPPETEVFSFGLINSFEPEQIKPDFKPFICEYLDDYYKVQSNRFCYERNDQNYIVFQQLIQRLYMVENEIEDLKFYSDTEDFWKYCKIHEIFNMDFGQTNIEQICFIFYVEQRENELKYHPGYINSKRVGKIVIEGKVYDYNPSWMKPIYIFIK
jgi:hypothetical protein